MAFGYDGSIRIDTKINQRGFNQGISGMIASLGKLASAVGLAFGVAALVNFGRESVKAASNLASALIGLQSIVEGQGRSFSQAQSFIQDYIKDGLIPMKDAVTAYKNLAMRGYGTEQIEKTMIALKNSSAFGRSAALSMGQAVSSATEGLRNENSILVDNSGVTKNVSMMWKDYAEKLGVGVQSLTKAQKIQAEVNGIMEETRFQMGDAEKAVSTYSGQVSMLSFNFNQLKVAVGEAIIPILQAVLPSVNLLILKMTELANVAAQVTTALFGKSPVKDQTEDEKDLAEAGKDAADANGDLAGATDEMGNAVEKAGKKVKGSLAPFDDLKKLAGSAADSVSDAADDINKGGGFDDLNQNLFGNVEVSPEILEFIEKLKNALQEVADILARFWKPFQDAWEKYGASVIESLKRALTSVWDLMKAIGKTFLEMWEKLGADKVLGVILQMLDGILNFISTLASQFQAVWAEMGEGLVEAFFFAVSAVLELIKSIGAAFVEAWNSGVGEQILETILSILTNIFNIVGTLATKLTEAWEANGNGVAIWTSILNVVELVLNFIDRLAASTLEWASKTNFEPLVVAFRNLLQSIEPFVAIVLDSLAFAYENVLLPLAEWVIGDAAPAAIDLLSGAVEALTAVVEALKPIGEWLWENFLMPIAAWTGGVIVSFLGGLADVLKRFGDWVSENKESVEAFVIIIGSFLTAWAAATAVSGIITGVVAGLHALAAAGGLVTIVTTAFGSAVAFLTSPITIAVVAIGALIAIIVLLAKNWDAVKEAAGVAWDFIKEKWGEAAAWISEKILDPIVDAFTGSINFMLGAVEGFVNFFIGGINAIIGALNTISFDIPDWVPLIGGNKFGFDIPEVPKLALPRLANGAVIPPNREFAAILGDQTSGRNFEAPESLLRQIVREEMSGAQSGGFTVEMPVYLDGREIWRNQQVVGKQMGTSLVGG